MHLNDPRERESMLTQRIKAEMALVMWRAIPTKPSPSWMSCVPAYLDMDNAFAFLSFPFVSVCPSIHEHGPWYNNKEYTQKEYTKMLWLFWQAFTHIHILDTHTHKVLCGMWASSLVE